MAGSDRNVFERHLQTGVQLILVALVLWAGSQLVAIGQQYAVLEERITAQGALLTELRAELKEWGELYYRRSEARRELDAIEDRIRSLDGRVSALEATP